MDVTRLRNRFRHNKHFTSESIPARRLCFNNTHNKMTQNGLFASNFSAASTSDERHVLLPPSIEFNLANYLITFGNQTNLVNLEVSTSTNTSKQMTIQAARHHQCLDVIKNNMIRYDVALEVDNFGMPMQNSNCLRPPFEKYSTFKSPTGFTKEIFLGAFNEEHCQQLLRAGWTPVTVHMINPTDKIPSSFVDGSAFGTELTANAVEESHESVSVPVPGALLPSGQINDHIPTDSAYWNGWNSEDRTWGQFIDWYIHGSEGQTYPPVATWTYKQRKCFDESARGLYRRLASYYLVISSEMKNNLSPDIAETTLKVTDLRIKSRLLPKVGPTNVALMKSLLHLTD